MKGLEMKILLAACAALAGSASAAELPKVWMSTQWRDPFEETVRMCAEQGVDAIEVPSWSTNHCAQVLAALRKYKVKGFTSSGEDTSETVPPGARIIGKGTEGMVMKAGEIAALRKKFAAEIALCGGK